MMGPIRVGTALLWIVLTQTPSPPAATITPGTISLLVAEKGEPAKARVREALRHSDPAVRAIAARVVATAPFPELKNDLFAALARERDASLGSELLHDLLDVAGKAAVDVADPQLRRLGAPGVLVSAEWLGRMWPERLMERLNDLVVIAPGADFDLAGIVAMSGSQHPEIRDRLFRAWMAAAPADTWRALLERAYAPPAFATAGTDILATAVSSERATVREETVWFLVGELAAGNDVPAQVLDAIAPPDADAPLTWDGFGRELLARARRKSAAVDRAAFLKTEAASHSNDAWRIRKAPWITSGERVVLEDTPGGPASGSQRGGRSTARLAHPVAPDTLSGVFDASGCKLKSEHRVGLAVLEYGEDGRSKRITVDPTGLSQDCVTALSTVARLTVAEPDYPATDGAQVLVLPFQRDVIACISQSPSRFSKPEGAARVGEAASGRRITQPKKIRDVKPEYPHDAESGRIQGVVIVEAEISRTGCVSAAHVVRGSYPSLDIAALIAVSGWQFTTTLLDGQPAPVIMTATVNFVLQ